MSDVKDVRGRYIYADKFITTIDSSDELDAYSAITVCELIKNESTADVIEVVRCKNCKFSHHADPNDNHDEYICDWHEQFYAKNSGLLWHSGDYCSYGKRREDGEVH